MATEEEQAPAESDFSPKGFHVDGAIEEQEDKISVGDMDEVNLEEGTARAVELRRHTANLVSFSIHAALNTVPKGTLNLQC